ncbi:helix-turn-helix domain-containing protein [Lysinibacillus sp. 1P01SD]|uniref:helix-turn-helix domain-containing protein n=1 Tax=Lysinibacillus sp. 1P01SD TaxID=3132285 RepID=UPI0039A29FEE
MSNGEKNKDYYTVDETAEILSLHRNTIMRRLKDGTLPFYRTKGDSGIYRIKRSAVDEMTQQYKTSVPKESNSDDEE